MIVCGWVKTPWYRRLNGKYRRLVGYYGESWWEYTNEKPDYMDEND